ncbi:homeobox protein TGIF2LX-like [Echinops telfairi]|uniref:Homeobox protein TGIF2LX-like n=1 Tax=Echinops telfairi TaxID=9371 RepID=A0ABM0IZ67_ECHTE|nr:homeobox protein TGIF2LX-like [Echinops telfairi]
MDAPGEILSQTKSVVQETPIILNTDTGKNAVFASPEGQRKWKGFLPPESIKILRDWLYEHRHSTHPSAVENKMLSEQTNLSLRQISFWFINARRRILPQILQQDGINPKQSNMKYQNGKHREMMHMQSTNSFTCANSGSRNMGTAQSLHLCPLLKNTLLGKKLLHAVLAPGQMLDIQPKKKFKICTSKPLPMSSPDPVI